MSMPPIEVGIDIKLVTVIWPNLRRDLKDIDF
jgi:hypothetical protein